MPFGVPESSLLPIGCGGISADSNPYLGSQPLGWVKMGERAVSSEAEPGGGIGEGDCAASRVGASLFKPSFGAWSLECVFIMVHGAGFGA